MGAGGVIRMKGEMDRNGRGGVVVLMVNVERKWKWKCVDVVCVESLWEVWIPVGK
jgi:hypothetical protein